MSKRRATVGRKSYSIPYIDVSPSKRRSLRRRVVSSSISQDKPSTSRPSVPSSCADGNVLVPEHGESPDSDLPSGEDVSFHNFEPDTGCQGQPYLDRQRKAADHWSKIRDQLQHVAVQTGIPPSNVCCIMCDELAVAVCADCSPYAFFCQEHVELLHSKINLFHRPDIWKNGFLQPYTFKQLRSFPVWNHTCSTTAYSKEVVCIDEKGFQHRVCVGFCACEPEAVTLVRHNMWPATPKKPSLAFHQDLLLWLESLILEGCIGVDAFCKALDCRRGRHISAQIRNIYPVIIEAFEEFRFNRHQLRSLKFLSPELDMTTICPACPKEGTRIISFDAVFGLCRKKSSGVSVRPPLFSEVFFEEQESIDQFVTSYDSASHMVDKGCHEFLAGDALRSKARYVALDETAVFGSICRHQFPQRFFSMKHGERLAYPVYLLQKFKQDMGSQPLMLLYDIACLLETHLKNRGRTDLLQRTTLGVPVFHVYGHCAFCQITYSPRVLSECGLTDGEAMERLWSYLRRFAKSTKEMRTSHRIDVLTSALLHYASKVRLNLDVSLCKRLKHAAEVRRKAEDELSRLIESSNGTLTDTVVQELEEKQLTILSRSPSYGQRHKAFQDVLLVARERKYLLSTKARYADGQSIATRLAKKITSTTSTLKRAISRFNGMLPDSLEGIAYELPRDLKWESVTNLEELSSLEVSSLASKSTVTVPIELWMKVVRASNMMRRASEEEQMVKNEFANLENSMKVEHSILLQHIAAVSQSSSPNSLYQNGCLNLLKRRLLLCEASLLSFAKSVTPYYTVNIPQLEILGSDTHIIDDSELEDLDIDRSTSLHDHCVESDSDDSDVESDTMS